MRFTCSFTAGTDCMHRQRCCFGCTRQATLICGTCKFSIYTKLTFKGRSLTILRFFVIPTSHISLSLSHYRLHHAAYMSINSKKVEIVFCPNLNFKIQRYGNCWVCALRVLIDHRKTQRGRKAEGEHFILYFSSRWFPFILFGSWWL